MNVGMRSIRRITRNFSLILWLLAVGMLGACDLHLPGERDELSFDQVPYLGDELRMDGFYYQSYATPDGDQTLHTVHFFYRNGVVRHVGTFESIESLGSDDFLSGDKPWHWGLFRVNETRFAFERWYPAEYAKAFIHSGEILNDTTFIIRELQRSNGGDIRSENETYYFRPFSPKPDSSSRYLN